MRLLATTFISLIALTTASPAYAEWWVAESDHFIVYSEGDEQEAIELASNLERVDGVMRLMQNLPSEGEDSIPVTVFRFGDTNDISRLAKSRGVAGFYIPRSSGSVAFVPAKKPRVRGSTGTRDPKSKADLDPETILYHEYAHHFMLQYFPANYPAWYIEAFAEVYGKVELMPEGVFRLGTPAFHRADQLYYDAQFPAEDLFLPASELKAGDNRHFYSVGWLLTHYLTFTNNRPGQLAEYLKLVDSGVSSMDAAKEAFGDLKKLSKEVKKYRSTAMYGIEMNPAGYKAPVITSRKLQDAEEKIINYVIRSKRGVSISEAKGMVDNVRDVAVQYPSNELVLAELIEAEFDSKNYSQADSAATTALAIDPEDSNALMYKGMVRMEQAKEDKTKFKDARAFFVEAYSYDSLNAQALIMNYLSYYKAEEAIPESAIIGLEQAYKIAPYDNGVRLLLARQFLNESKGELAMFVLTPIAAASAHTNSKKENPIVKAVSFIEEKNFAAASAQLNKVLDEEEES